MCQTIFLSKMLGCFVTIMAFFILTNKKKFQHIATQFLHSPALMFISGCVSSLLGLYTVITHNVWALDFSIIITLIGWAILLQGILRIFSPHFFIEGVKTFIEKGRFLLLAWVLFLLGLYLVWNSF